MSTVDSFLVQTMSISRLATTTSAEAGTSYASKYTGVACLLQPVNDVTQLLNAGNFGKEFKLFCASTIDILTGDQVTIDSVIYGVNGVNTHSDLEESDNFKQCVVTLIKNVQ